ncbi:MAG: DUF3794 domain-containing protein [Clostridiales bacterium]|jgi:hypothetical protein|nr:DUF3794 domain-containing protein [Eubacteriales bacterium]MDH7567885.1 DUF3794 domain-containing protein [Clostridiales bacterium]
MANVVRDLVEIVGIADNFPTAPVAFAQFSVMEKLVIPDAKPDIEQILKVLIEARVTSTRIVVTPVGTSTGGLVLTGAKLVVEGVVKQKITYVSAAPDQAVHAAEFDLPFSTFMVLPTLTVPITPGIVNQINVEPFIEDVYVNLENPRTILKNVTLFLNATSALFA